MLSLWVSPLVLGYLRAAKPWVCDSMDTQALPSSDLGR